MTVFGATSRKKSLRISLAKNDIHRQRGEVFREHHWKGYGTFKMTWRTRRVSWCWHSELVEFLHPGQENVHFSKGFGLG